jgi:hypothetical protein
MNNLISEYNETGVCIIDVNNVCNKWSDKFAILQFQDDYTFVIFGAKGIYKIKVKISQEQAKEIISCMQLLTVKDSFFASAKTYRTRKFIEAKYMKVDKILKDKTNELKVLTGILQSYRHALALID